MAEFDYVSQLPPGTEPSHYSAVAVSVDEDFEQGRIRIEPPFTAPDRFYELLSSDVGVDILPYVATPEGLVLDFFVDNTGTNFGMSNRERVRSTVAAMLEEVSLASNVDLFRNQYEVKEDK